MIFEIPKKHYLEIKLPYEVDQDAGNAKYDKKNKSLKVQLPLTKSAANLALIQSELSQEKPLDSQDTQNNEENSSNRTF